MNPEAAGGRDLEGIYLRMVSTLKELQVREGCWTRIFSVGSFVQRKKYRGTEASYLPITNGTSLLRPPRWTFVVNEDSRNLGIRRRGTRRGRGNRGLRLKGRTTGDDSAMLPLDWCRLTRVINSRAILWGR